MNDFWRVLYEHKHNYEIEKYTSMILLKYLIGKGGDKMKIQFKIVIGSWSLTITITKKEK